MSVEPGWYHAAGDPPHTVRRWNGDEWIGFPIARPGSELTLEPAAQTFRKTPGQRSLKTTAILAQLALLALALPSLVSAYAYFRLGALPQGLDATPDSEGTLFAWGILGQLLAAPFAALAFIVWFALAYRNIALWTHTRRGTYWAVLVWFVPFINAIRPMSMMLELIEHSPRPDRRGELSPTPVILWWFLWILPGIAGGLVLLNIMRTDLSQAVRGLLVVQGVVTVLSVISIMLAIYLVQQVTDSQQRRLEG